MWPFKIKLKKIGPKIKRSIKYKEPKKFNIQRTIVGIELDNNIYFKSAVYGSVYQNYIADPVKITSSLSYARDYISGLLGDTQNFVDDIKNINEIVIGRAIRAEIISTSDYEFEFQEAYVEETEVYE